MKILWYWNLVILTFVTSKTFLPWMFADISWSGTILQTNWWSKHWAQLGWPTSAACLHIRNARHPCPCMAFHLYFSWKKGEKRICDCHWASRGCFLLGWRAAEVFCHGASEDIMWAYQVAARVTGSMWVTQCLVSSEPEHFLPSFCPLSVATGAKFTESWKKKRKCFNVH